MQSPRNYDAFSFVTRNVVLVNDKLQLGVRPQRLTTSAYGLSIMLSRLKYCPFFRYRLLHKYQEVIVLRYYRLRDVRVSAPSYDTAGPGWISTKSGITRPAQAANSL